jgi:hypothetical protein
VLDDNKTIKSYGIKNSNKVYVGPKESENEAEPLQVTVKMEGNDDVDLEVCYYSCCYLLNCLLIIIIIVIITVIILQLTDMLFKNVYT